MLSLALAAGCGADNDNDGAAGYPRLTPSDSAGLYYDVVELTKCRRALAQTEIGGPCAVGCAPEAAGAPVCVIAGDIFTTAWAVPRGTKPPRLASVTGWGCSGPAVSVRQLGRQLATDDLELFGCTPQGDLPTWPFDLYRLGEPGGYTLPPMR